MRRPLGARAGPSSACAIKFPQAMIQSRSSSRTSEHTHAAPQSRVHRAVGAAVDEVDRLRAPADGAEGTLGHAALDGTDAPDEGGELVERKLAESP